MLSRQPASVCRLHRRVAQACKISAVRNVGQPRSLGSTATRAASITEVSVFLEEIAVAQTPKRLPALIKVLEAQGCKALLPVQREGLHPLLVPVCSATGNSDSVTCLLRWPQPSKHPNMTMPVVRMERGARNVTLVARSVDEYLHRLLAEEDLAAGTANTSRPLADAAGEQGMSLYRQGDAAAAGFNGAKASLYIVRKAGYFPDVCESLALGHLGRGDHTSALVASEWYMRNNFFPGWARPYEFAAELLMQLKNREEEARDLARVALRLPWWTLSKDFAAVQRVAQLEGKTPEKVRYLLSEEAAAAAQVTATGRPAQKEPKSPQQLALERAEALLDMVAAGAQPNYESVRAELAEAYHQAGLHDVANFITASS